MASKEDSALFKDISKEEFTLNTYYRIAIDKHNGGWGGGEHTCLEMVITD